MCGITGAYNYKNQEPVASEIVAAMMDAIHHRGPDESGMYVAGPVGLGSKRLSIIDLETSQQPITNESGDVVVVYNGETYNYRELRHQLQQRGHSLRTAGDTEVIPHLYEDYGLDCVDWLRGMFGFALWDDSQRRLVLARDRLGIKPLYYADTGERLLFGSEIKAILQAPDMQVRPNLEALSNFLSLKYVPAPQTMFDGIRALPPGHILVCDSDGPREHRYWDMSFQAESNPARPESDWAEELEALLRESVQMRLISDVPFGAFLSGGVDSSTVVALMSEFLDEPVKTFSVGFSPVGGVVSELPNARLVAERFGTDHREVMVEPQHLVDLGPKLTWHLDQPIADQGTLGNYLVADLAADHVKMVLSGEGADELFAGYARYPGERVAHRLGALPGPVRRWASDVAHRLPGRRRAKLALNALAQPDEVTRLSSWFPLFNTTMKRGLLRPEIQAELSGVSPAPVFEDCLAACDAADSVSRLLYVDTKLWLPDDLLARGDKTSMAASLEARVPFLDHKLVEFAAALPRNLKLNGLKRKYLLKKVSSKLLPPEIINQKKRGFPIPFSEWFRGSAREFVRDHLASEALDRRQIFDAPFVMNLLDEHERGFADHGALIWGLLSTELWYREFVDASPRRVAKSPTLPV